MGGVKTTKTQFYLKFINCYDNGGFSSWKWPPVGVWTPRIRLPLVMCRRGYHVLKPSQVSDWFLQWGRRYEKGYYSQRGKVYLVECETHGKKEECDKVVTRRARLVKELRWTNKDMRTDNSVKRWLKSNGVKIVD